LFWTEVAVTINQVNHNDIVTSHQVIINLAAFQGAGRFGDAVFLSCSVLEQDRKTKVGMPFLFAKFVIKN
jgi:hypothetical protein